MVKTIYPDEDCCEIVVKPFEKPLGDMKGVYPENGMTRKIHGSLEDVRLYLTDIADQVGGNPTVQKDITDLLNGAGISIDEEKMMGIQMMMAEILPNIAEYAMGDDHGKEMKVTYHVWKTTTGNYLFIEAAYCGRAVDPNSIKLVDYGKLVDQGRFPVEAGGHLHIGLFLATTVSDMLALYSRKEGAKIAASVQAIVSL